MMFFLKNKSKQFGAFKAWAERHTDRQLKCIRTERGGEFLSNEQKKFMEEFGIEHQTSMPDSPQQNGRAEWFQQTILNKGESMRHMAGLSSGFWSYAIRTAIHVYNLKEKGRKVPELCYFARMLLAWGALYGAKKARGATFVPFYSAKKENVSKNRSKVAQPQRETRI